MSAILPEGELLRRAAAWICEERAHSPERSLSSCLDEAGMRFNLGPMDQRLLVELFKTKNVSCGDIVDGRPD